MQLQQRDTHQTRPHAAPTPSRCPPSLSTASQVLPSLSAAAGRAVHIRGQQPRAWEEQETSLTSDTQDNNLTLLLFPRAYFANSLFHHLDGFLPSSLIPLVPQPWASPRASQGFPVWCCIPKPQGWVSALGTTVEGLGEAIA